MNVLVGKELCYFTSPYRLLHCQHLASYQAYDRSVTLSVPILVVYAGWFLALPIYSQKAGGKHPCQMASHSPVGGSLVLVLRRREGALPPGRKGGQVPAGGWLRLGQGSPNLSTSSDPT